MRFFFINVSLRLATVRGISSVLPFFSNPCLKKYGFSQLCCCLKLLRFTFGKFSDRSRFTFRLQGIVACYPVHIVEKGRQVMFGAMAPNGSSLIFLVLVYFWNRNWNHLNVSCQWLLRCNIITVMLVSKQYLFGYKTPTFWDQGIYFKGRLRDYFRILKKECPRTELIPNLVCQ